MFIHLEFHHTSSSLLAYTIYRVLVIVFYMFNIITLFFYFDNIFYAVSVFLFVVERFGFVGASLLLFIISLGGSFLSTVFFVIMHFSILGFDGISNIMSLIISSTIERKPLAPVFLSIALVTIASNASLSNSNSTLSYFNNFLYCFTNEFLGSVIILN